MGNFNLMNIREASNELYNTLKDNKEVVGTGVEKANNMMYIIIYLTQATQNILRKIPAEYRGNKVKTQVSGHFSAFTA